MDRNDFYKKLESFKIDINLTIGLGDVIDTLTPEEADKIVDFIKDLDALSLANTNSDSYEEMERRKNENLESILKDIEKIPVFDSEQQSKEDFLKAHDFDLIHDSWQKVRERSSKQILLLSSTEDRLIRSIKELRYTCDKNAKKIKIIEDDTRKKSLLNEEQLRQRKHMIDVIKESNKVLLEKIARIENEHQQNIKEHTFQTIINNYAKTKMSQILSLQREKEVLMSERKTLTKEQKDAIKEVEQSKEKNKNILERIGQYGNSIKFYKTNMILDSLDRKLLWQIESVKDTKRLIEECEKSHSRFAQYKVKKWKENVEQQQEKIEQTIKKIAKHHKEGLQEVSKVEGRKGSIDLEESWTSFRKKQFAEAVEELLSNDILTKEQIKDLRNDFETLGFEIDISEHEITVDSIDLKDSMDDFEIER